MEFGELFAGKKAALAHLEKNADYLMGLARQEAINRGHKIDRIVRIMTTMSYKKFDTDTIADQKETDDIFVIDSSKAKRISEYTSTGFEFRRQIDGYDYKITVIF